MDYSRRRGARPAGLLPMVEVQTLGIPCRVCQTNDFPALGAESHRQTNAL